MEAAMYWNPYQWRRIRKRVLVSGESIRSVARMEGMSRKTLRKILSHESPPGYGGRSILIANPERPRRRSRSKTFPRRDRKAAMDGMALRSRTRRVCP